MFPRSAMIRLLSFGLALAGCSSKLKVRSVEAANARTERTATKPAPKGATSPYRITGPEMNGKYNADDILVTWEDAGFNDYVVTLSTTPDCKHPAYAFSNITHTRHTIGSLEEGTYFICVMAKGADGLFIPAANNGLEVTIDRTPPGEFAVTSPPPRTNAATPLVTWSEASGVFRYDVSVSRREDCTSPVQSFENLADTRTTLKPLVAEGDFTVCVRARDEAGNQRLAKHAFTYTTTVPRAQLAGVPSSPSVDAALNVSVSGTDVVDYQYAVVASPAVCGGATYSAFRPASTPMTDALPRAGLLQLCVKGRDSYGNVQANPTTASWTRNVPPLLTFGTPAAGIHQVAASATFAVNIVADDPDSVADVSLYYGTDASACQDGSLAGWTTLTTSLREGVDTTFAWNLGGVVPSGDYSLCGKIDDHVNSPVFALSPGRIHVNAPPSLSVSEPSTTRVIAQDATFTITWTAADADDDASLAFFRKPTATGACTAGTKIVDGLKKSGPASYAWDTSGLAPGDHAICGVIDDGVNPPVESWAAGKVTINGKASFSFTAPTGSVKVPAGGTYTVTFTAADPDDAATISLYRKSANTACTDGTLTGWTEITSSLKTGIDGSYAWAMSGVPAGSHYLCARVSDGVNPPLYVLSPGTVSPVTLPTFAFTSPSGFSFRDAVEVGNGHTVTWALSAPDSDPQVKLYVSSANFGACADNGATLLATFRKSTDPGSHAFTAGSQTTGLYFCANVDDGINPPQEIRSSWLFVYHRCAWTGAVDADWATAGNWAGCGGISPHPYDRVSIPAGAPRQPLVTQDRTIDSFFGGPGGGTVTITAGATLQVNNDQSFTIPVTLQGSPANCATCVVNVANQAKIINGATLTLGKGIDFSSFLTTVGTDAEVGNLETEPASGDPAEWPRVHRPIYVQGVSAAGKSSLKLDGVVLSVDAGYLTHVVMKSFSSVDRLDNIRFRSESTPVTSAYVVNFPDCQDVTFNDTSWDNWLFPDFMPMVSVNLNGTDCSALPTVAVSGSGIGYHPQAKFDPYGKLNFANNSHVTCTWTGAADSDWKNPANWSGCANGRGGFPDLNDDAIIPSGPANQPLVSSHAGVRHLALGTGGGTITIAPDTVFALVGDSALRSLIRSSVTMQGQSPTCTTCAFAMVNDVRISDDAVLTLGKGLSIDFDEAYRLYVGSNASPGHLRAIGGPIVAERPTFKEVLHTNKTAGIVVEGPSPGARSSIDIDGVNFWQLASDQWRGYVTRAIRFRGNVDIVKLDNVQAKALNANALDFPLIHFETCAGTSTVAQWNNIDFFDAMITGGANIDASGPNCTIGNGMGITVNGQAASAGYGAAHATDPNGIISWN